MKKKLLYITSAFMILPFQVNQAYGQRAGIHWINPGQTIQIEAYGRCRKWTNNTDKQILIPAKTPEEYGSIIKYAPFGLSNENCDNSPYVGYQPHYSCPSGSVPVQYAGRLEITLQSNKDDLPSAGEAGYKSTEIPFEAGKLCRVCTKEELNNGSCYVEQCNEEIREEKIDICGGFGQSFKEYQLWYHIKNYGGYCGLNFVLKKNDGACSTQPNILPTPQAQPVQPPVFIGDPFCVQASAGAEEFSCASDKITKEKGVRNVYENYNNECGNTYFDVVKMPVCENKCTETIEYKELDSCAAGTIEKGQAQRTANVNSVCGNNSEWVVTKPQVCQPETVCRPQIYEAYYKLNDINNEMDTLQIDCGSFQQVDNTIPMFAKYGPNKRIEGSRTNYFENINEAENSKYLMCMSKPSVCSNECPSADLEWKIPSMSTPRIELINTKTGKSCGYAEDTTGINFWSFTYQFDSFVKTGLSTGLANSECISDTFNNYNSSFPNYKSLPFCK